MNYTSFYFYIFLFIAVFTYYLAPKKVRWIVLLISNFVFIWLATLSIPKLMVFITTILISYGFGLSLEKKKSRLLLALGIIISASPLLISRSIDLICASDNHSISFTIIEPLGLAFYSMQIIAYLADIYTGKISTQSNLAKYALFVSFFPQIIQGPIPRFADLSDQLVEGHSFDEDNLMRGIQLILWGFFLKFMIADKAGVIVNTIFGDVDSYLGFYIWVAGILYSLQLYSDFLACITLSQGIGQIFGIRLSDNFAHPYFAESIKDFWRRWHISLSSWLKDYIYIPLGGNRHGRLRKYFNLLITFSVSGFWHGSGFNYIIWGLLHGIYQVIEDLIPFFHKKRQGATRIIRMGINFYFVMTAWIIFRAGNLFTGLRMIARMYRNFNPWIFFDNSLYNLGLSRKELDLMLISLTVLFIVSLKQEEGLVLRDKFADCHWSIRWCIYILVIITLWVFGSYGYGYNAADFIYGGF